MESGVFSLPRKLTVENADQVFLSRTPTTTANSGVLNIGDGPLDGVSSGKFVGSVNGTFIALNAAAGYSGKLIDLQVAGISGIVISPGCATGVADTTLAITASSAWSGGTFANFSYSGTSRFSIDYAGTLITSGEVRSANFRFIGTGGSFLVSNTTSNVATAFVFTSPILNASNFVQTPFTWGIDSSSQTSTAGWTGLKLNVTDSASTGIKLLTDLQVGTVTKFKVDSLGNTTSAGQINDGTGIGAAARLEAYRWYS